jgi:hypothetical protein
MARNDSRTNRTEPLDRAHLRAGAESWHALAATALLVMGVAPALLIAALVLLESVLTTSPREMVRRSAEPPSWHADVLPRFQLSNTCARLELAPCLRD